MKTLVKYVLLITLVAAAIEFTMNGESGAFGGILVKMGVMDSREAPPLDQRVKGKLDKAKQNEARRMQEVDETANTGD